MFVSMRQHSGFEWTDDDVDWGLYSYVNAVVVWLGYACRFCQATWALSSADPARQSGPQKRGTKLTKGVFQSPHVIGSGGCLAGPLEIQFGVCGCQLNRKFIMMMMSEMKIHI